MKCSDKTVMFGISEGLKQMKKQTDYQINFIADMLDIPHRTFEGYLYGTSTPTLSTLIELSNQFRYPLNNLFSHLIDSGSNEQRYIIRIYDAVRNKTDQCCTQIRSVINPIFDSISDSFPILKDEDFGGKLRILREDYPLSRKTFSDACDMTQTTLKQLESNQHMPSVSIFCKICKTLEVSPEYLLAKRLVKLSSDSNFYALTPRQLKAFAEAIEQLCRYF